MNNANNDSISKYLSGNMSPDEMELFMNELDNSVELQRELSAASIIFNSSSKNSFQDFKKTLPKEAKIISINKTEKLEVEVKPKAPKYWMGIAASVAVLISLGIWQQFFNSADYLTVTSQMASVTQKLPDGSVVTLNKNSKLTYDLTNKEQRVATLVGEAFFEVAKDANHPFLVNTKSAQVSVLGTSFLVNTMAKDSVFVLVETGKVGFASHNNIEKPVYLLPGDKGALSKANSKIKKSLNLAVNHMYWKDKTLIFRKTKLEKVTLVLKDIYDIDIQLNNDKLKDCKISATFKNESAENILNVIGATFNFKVKKENNQFVIDGEGC